MAFRMTMGHPRPWPGYPHHTGLISAAMTDVIATCSSHPRFRHQLSSDPASRRAPLLRRMVPVITVHKGLPPLNAHHYSTHQARMPVPRFWVLVNETGFAGGTLEVRDEAEAAYLVIPT